MGHTHGGANPRGVQHADSGRARNPFGACDATSLWRVERIAERLRRCGLLPEKEVHDSIVLTEAAALGCALLTSSDADLRSVDRAKLSRELAKFDLIAPVIATPREIVRKFFR